MTGPATAPAGAAGGLTQSASVGTGHRRQVLCPARLRRRLACLLALLLPLVAPGTLAGELSEVPAKSPPGFYLPDLSGQLRSLDEFAGKAVLVNFWASWCTPCIREMPSLRRLAGEMHEKPFAIVSINVAETERRVKVNAKRLGIEFPVLLDKDRQTFDRWGATILPTAFLIDRDGKIRYLARGELEWDRIAIVEIVQTLANRMPNPGRRPLQTDR